MPDHKRDEEFSGSESFLRPDGSEEKRPVLVSTGETLIARDMAAAAVHVKDPAEDPCLLLTDDGKLFLRHRWDNWYRIRVTDPRHLIMMLKNPRPLLLENYPSGNVKELNVEFRRIAVLPDHLFQKPVQ